MLGKRFLKMFAMGLALGGAASVAQAGDVEFNGFGSLYYAQSLERQLLAPNMADEKPDFSTFSLFGLNVGSRLTNEITLAAQLIAAPSTTQGTWGMNANWAYAQYKPIDSVALKLGRQLFPVFIGSEYDKVAQLLPYRRIPGITTLAPFSGFEGISGNYTFGLTETVKFTLGLFGGRPNYELTNATKGAGYTGNADELLGATATVDGDGWRVRTMYSRNRAYLGVPANVFGASAVTVRSLVDQFSAGYRFDKYNFVSWGEYIYRSGNDGTKLGASGTEFLQALRGGYVLVGYRIGDFMPRFTYLRSDANILLGTGGYTSQTIGVNYAISPTTTFKVDYEMLNGLDNGVYGLTRQTGSTQKDGSAVYAGLDFIF